MEKQPFYIFLEINGVLYDEKSAYDAHGFFYPVSEPKLKSSSINALNFLIEKIEKNYDSKLIIISRRRKNLPYCISYIKYFGVKYNKPFFATEFTEGPRGKKILKSMNDDGLIPHKKPTVKTIISNLLTTAKDDNSFKNYVVINPKSSKISKYIPKEHLIVTDRLRNSLTQEQVNLFLSSIGLLEQNQKGE